MADNIAPNVVQQQLAARFRIPNETWTDVFQMLPRRILVKKVVPVCVGFKQICDRNVKSVHMIRRAQWFCYKLKSNDPIAKKQWAQLEASKCKLSSQFRMRVLKFGGGRKNMAMVSHCFHAGLLEGCQISLFPRKKEGKDNLLFIYERLSLLKWTKPVLICVFHSDDKDEPEAESGHLLLCHPTVRNCSRLLLYAGNTPPGIVNRYVYMEIYAKAIADWLNYQPAGTSAAEEGEEGEEVGQVRCLIFNCSQPNDRRMITYQVFEQCLKAFQEAKLPADRRQFVLSFHYRRLPMKYPCRRIVGHPFDENGMEPFGPHENTATGELLFLERVKRADGKPTTGYRFRRCLAQDVANGEEFYANIFRDYEDEDDEDDDEDDEEDEEEKVHYHFEGFNIGCETQAEIQIGK